MYANLKWHFGLSCMTFRALFSAQKRYFQIIFSNEIILMQFFLHLVKIPNEATANFERFFT
jgi:hypothetical protein